VSTFVLVALGGGLSVGAEYTRPFTDGADVVVSVVLVAMVVVLSIHHRIGRSFPLLERRPDREVFTPFSARRWLPWAFTAIVALGWELGSLFSLPRSAHPTISSMLDAVDGSHLGRGISFAAWLAVGWYLVTR
jgi:hypothetical protein